MTLDFSSNHKNYYSSTGTGTIEYMYFYSLDFVNKSISVVKRNTSNYTITEEQVSSSTVPLLSSSLKYFWMIKTASKLHVNLSNNDFQKSSLKVSYSNGVTPSYHFLDYSTMIGFDQASVIVSLHTYRPPNLSSDLFYRTAYVTFHYDEVSDKAYAYFYINPLYVSAYGTTPHYIEYEVYKVNLSLKYTNCCLKKCFEPNKYILI